MKEAKGDRWLVLDDEDRHVGSIWVRDDFVLWYIKSKTGRASDRYDAFQKICDALGEEG